MRWWVARSAAAMGVPLRQWSAQLAAQLLAMRLKKTETPLLVKHIVSRFSSTTAARVLMTYPLPVICVLGIV